MTAKNLNDNQHPSDSEDGNAASHDDSVIGNVIQYFDSIFDAFHRLPEVHDEVLDEIVENRLSMLRSLPGVDACTLKRIEPAVAENTRFLHSREWSTSWAKAVITKPVLENSLMIASYVILPLGALIVALSGHHLHIGNNLTFLASILTCLIFGIVIWQIARLIRFATRRKILGIRKIVIAVTVTWLTILSTTDRSQVSALAQRYAHDIPRGVRRDYSHVLWATAIHNALWVIACILVLRALSVFFEYFIKNLILARVTKSSGAVLYSAAIQDSLLNIAFILNKNLCAREKGDLASVPNDVRTYVIDMIAEVASTIEGPWIRSLRTGYRSTDERTAQVGYNIAHSLRSWQSHAVFGGQHFETIRDDCTRSYVNTLDGNWERIAVDDESPKSLRVTRLNKILRRLTAMILPVLLAFAAVRIIPHSMDSYKPFLILASILLAFIEIIALVDPDIVERINTVVNVTNSIRRTPKP